MYKQDIVQGSMDMGMGMAAWLADIFISCIYPPVQLLQEEGCIEAQQSQQCISTVTRPVDYVRYWLGHLIQPVVFSWD